MKNSYKTKWRHLLAAVFLSFSSTATYAQAWQLITDEASIQSGEQYVFATTPNGQEGTHYVGSFNKDRSCLDSKDTPFYWCIEKLSNGYRLYYQQNALKTYITTGESTNIKLGNSDNRWNISFSAGDHSIVLSANNKNNPNRSIQYSSEYDYFKNYAYNTEGKIYLLKAIDLPTPEISGVSDYFYPQQPINIQVSDENCEIHYTTDGSVPSAQSPLYTGSFTISKTTTINAVTIQGQAISKMASRTFYLASPITVRFGGSEHLGTYYAPFATQKPDEVRAYYVTGLDEESHKLLLQSYSGNVLPANIPFILQNQSETEVILNYTSQSAEAPQYDQSLIMGTDKETEVPSDKQIYALGYNEKNPSEFGFCRYTGTILAANKAYLMLSSIKYRLRTSDLQPGQYLCVLATQKDEDNQPAGIAWGAYNESDKKIGYVKMPNNQPTEWTFTVSDGQTATIEKDRCKLAVYEKYPQADIYDYNQQNTKRDYSPNWTVTYQPETSKFRIGQTIYPTKSIAFDDFYQNIKFYQRSENDKYQDFYLFEVNTEANNSTTNAAAFFSLSLPKVSGLISPTFTTNHAQGIYTIDGRKLSRIQKGYNIVNGKVIYKP